MNEREVQIKSVIDALDNKDFGLYFFVLDTMGNPVAGIANIYEHVKVLNDLGYKAVILHEKNDYHGVGAWLGEEYMKLPHLPLSINGAQNENVKIVSADFIIIPEIFSTIMEQVKNFPCKKLVFSQSYNYIYELLPIGKKWSDYGFKDVITTSKKQADYLQSQFYGINTHVVPVSIPEYFKPKDGIQDPFIAILTRDQSTTGQLVKSFYAQYPQFKWVSFREMRGLPRKQFAEDLKNSILGVWVDENAGFGTFPVEAMECNVPVIATIPNLIPEWMEEAGEEDFVNLKHNGVWTNNILNIPQLMAAFMKKWLEDDKDLNVIYDAIKSSQGQYTEAKQVGVISEVYSTIIGNRRNEFTTMLELEKTKEQ